MPRYFFRELFRHPRPRRHRLAVAAVVERLENRCVLTFSRPLILSVTTETPLVPDENGGVPALNLQVQGLNLLKSNATFGLNTFVVDYLALSNDFVLLSPSPGRLRWGENAVTLDYQDDGAGETKTQTFFFVLPYPKLKITGFETEPARIELGNSFVIAIEGENFTNDLAGTLAVTHHPDDEDVSFSFLERSPTHLLIGVSGGAIERAGSYRFFLSGTNSGSYHQDFIDFEVHKPPPEIASVSPSSLVLDDDVVHFTINGSGFSTIENGLESFVVLTPDGDESNFVRIFPGQVTESQINLYINPSELRQWTGFTVTVINRSSLQALNEGDASNEVHVTLTPPTPVINSLSEVGSLVGSATKTIEIEGESFTNAIVRFGTTVLTPLQQSANVVRVEVPATLLNTAGTTTVTVENQDPDGNTISNAKPFGIFDAANAIQLSSNSFVIDGSGTTSFTASLVQARATPTFQPGATVRFNGVTVGTVTGTDPRDSIIASIPASSLLEPGVVSVTIVNANGEVFGPVSFFVKSPRPTHPGNQSASIGTVVVGTEKVLTLVGTNFLPNARVLLNGAEVPSKFIDSQTIEATIEADRLPLVPGTDATLFPLTVENPAPRVEGTPDVWNFLAEFPTPTIDAISTNRIEAGSPTQTIRIAGTGFLAGITRAIWDSTGAGDLLPTTVLSDSLMTVELSAERLAFGGTHQIAVVTDSYFRRKSNEVTFDVMHPRPVLTEITPSFAATRSSQPLLTDPSNVTVTIKGHGFNAASQLRIEGPNGVQFISLSQLLGVTDTQFDVALSLIQPVGGVTLSVVNPTPGGGTSNPMSFVFTKPRPRVTAVAERTFGGGISAGAPNTLISVTGVDFVDGADIVWNGVKLETTFVSATRLDATVPAELLRLEGTALVGVSGGEAPESAQPFGVPVSPFFAIISGISPDNAPPGSGSRTVTVTGNYFLDGAVAQWNGEPRATTYVSGQQVTMTLTAADLAQVGSGTIRVVNPNGMTFGTRSFSVRNPLPVITSISPATVTAGSVTAPNVLSLTIHGTNFGTDPFGMSVEVNTPDNPNNFRSQTTVVDSPTQMRVLIPADQIATARTAQIQIRQTGVGVSNRFDLVINNGSFSIVATNALRPEGNAATTSLTFTVTRSGATSTGGSVDYTVTGSGANPADAHDFAGSAFPTATVNFAPNQTSQVVTINVAGDTTIEPNETFDITLSNPTGVSLGTTTATGTITNDDSAFTIAAASAINAEGNAATSPFTFKVTRSGATTGAGSVKFAVTGSGATPAIAADFGSSFPTGTVSFAAGETSKTVTINVKGDAVFEADEDFTVTLNSPVGGVLGESATANGTILNDDSGFSIAATDANKAEGNSGTTPFTFTVIRNGATITPASLKFTVTAPSGGVNGADFGVTALPSGTLNFAPGETSKMITLNVIGDTTIENDENFVVALSAPVGASLGTASANGTIQTDDTALVIAIAPNGSSKVEGHSGATAHTFTVTRTGLTTGATSVDFQVSGVGPNPADEADFGGEFLDGTLEFAAGEIAKVIAVNATGDTAIEPTETFSVTLSNPIGASSLLSPTATGTIVADDSSFSVTPLSASKAEGNSGNAPFTFTVTRNGSTLGVASVSFAITGSGDSPADAADFGTAFPSGLISFKTGEASKVVTINVKGDTAFEPDEGFTITLSNPVGGTLDVQTAPGTILSDDATLAIAVDSADQPEGTGGSTPFTFTVTRTGGVNVPASAKYTVAANGSGAAAASATDFVGGKFPTGILNFLASETTATLTIHVNADNLIEAAETFKVTLSSPVGTNLGAIVVANGTIQNDDSVVSIAATSANKSEGTTDSTPFTFTVTRTGDTTDPASVNYAVAGATKNGADVADFGEALPSGTVEFATNETSKLITINVIADTIGELNEGFVVTLSDPVNTSLGKITTATGTIINDDTSFSITPASATSANKAEGSSTSNPLGNTAFTFLVTRIGLPVVGSVQFAVNGSGDNPADADDFANATLPTGTLTFAANKGTQTVTINVRADRLVEANEGFTVTLANPTGATLANTSANGTIVNDDTSFAIAVTDATKAEGNTGLTAFTFTVTRDGVTTGTANVKFAVIGTLGANPTIAADFGTHVPASTVSFAAGETTKLITINVKGDTTVESDEGFTVTLSSPSTGATILIASALGTILNDD